MREIEIGQLPANDIKSYFLSLNQEEISSQKFLTEFILKKIGVSFRKYDFFIKKNDYLKGGYQIKILADELARFLLFINEHKNEINSYLEFGTGTGGSFYTIDSYLRAINPNMGNSCTVDRIKKYPQQFEEYKKCSPLANYSGNRTENFKMDKKYDLCFIDANHRYGAVKKDYERVKDNCRFIAFHDILTVDRATPALKYVRHLWKELKADHKIEIITDDRRVRVMSAIGIIWND